MRKCLLFSFLVIILSDLKAQALEWSKLFDKHSIHAFAPIEPTSILTSDGSMVTGVVERDTLQLYKTAPDGTISAYYSSHKNCKEFTPLLRTETGQMIVFQEQTLENNFWLLHTDNNLNVIREALLDFTDLSSIPDINHLIEYDDRLFLSLFGGSQHYLFRINEDDSLTMIYSGEVPIAFGEDIHVLENGNFIFSFIQANHHQVRCVSPENGEVIWEYNSELPDWQLMDYRTAVKNNEIYTIAIERTWVDGERDDKIRLTKLAAANGEVMSQTVMSPPGNCTVKINDFQYDETNNFLYFSYSHCFPEYGVTLYAINPQTLETEKQNTFEIQHDQLSIGEDAYVHVNSGRVTLIYKSFKNELENGNLYIVTLDEDLNSTGNLEINFDEINSSETVTHVLGHGENGLFLTGIIPSPEPFIFWEEVNYYTLMVDLDSVMATQNTYNNPFMVYPNPAKESVNISLPDDEIYSLKIFDLLGQMVYNKTPIQGKFELDVSTYEQGVYFVSMSDGKKTLNRQLIIKK